MIWSAATMGDDVRLVRLFKCKTCGARMFEKDTTGHIERHELSGANGSTLEYFVKGVPDTPDRPGSNRSYYRPKKKTPKEAIL